MAGGLVRTILVRLGPRRLSTIFEIADRLTDQAEGLLDLRAYADFPEKTGQAFGKYRAIKLQWRVCGD